jgi:hypothetical protein
MRLPEAVRCTRRQKFNLVGGPKMGTERFLLIGLLCILVHFIEKPMRIVAPDAVAEILPRFHPIDTHNETNATEPSEDKFLRVDRHSTAAT